jgi:hypothetical protein
MVRVREGEADILRNEGGAVMYSVAARRAAQSSWLYVISFVFLISSRLVSQRYRQRRPAHKIKRACAGRLKA